MSCIHIEGTRRTGDGTPLNYGGKANRSFEVEQNAKHENEKVRASAAASPHATRAVLDALASDESDLVREWVARNNKAHRTTLWKLADDPNPRVRAFVAWNMSAPRLLVKYLLEDASGVVRNIAKVVLDNAAADSVQ